MTGMVPLKRLARIRYGLGQPPPAADVGVPILRATNINRGRISSANLMRSRLVDLPLDRAPLLVAGEILVVRSGAYTGDSARVPEEWAGSAPGYDLRVTPEFADSRYLAYSVLGSAALDQMALVSTRAAQPHLNAEELGEVGICVPALEEQRRIVDFLDAETGRLDSIITLRAKQVELLRSGEGSLLERLLPQVNSVRTRVKYLSTRITSGPRGWGELVSDEGSLFVRITNIPRRGVRLDLRDSLYVAAPTGLERERSRIKLGDVLLSITADIGSVAIADERAVDGNISQHVAMVRPSGEVDPQWLAYAIKSSRSNQALRMNSYGGTKVGLGLGDVADLAVDAPDLRTQRAVATRIDLAIAQRTELSSQMQRQLELLKERRQALITAAVTGQFDVSTASGRNVADGVTV
ncbi:restriction endonuclease subunit S [Streptomyces decoyicus]|uniref:restriction endonuclease subunit S n=1 Tax=Streptomyces decoyicus TaxID=249567 RepID=UPI00381C2521